MRQISFRLKPGQDLRQEIEKAAAGIKAGVLLSVVGNLENAKLRMAGAVADKDVVKDLAGPFEKKGCPNRI
ncbi:MAG: DNA-binding protein [Candidatus Doudnabacteria bacterium]|nr:DNA-binding protein [Candidatus Doudnabacteria bacterium]